MGRFHALLDVANAEKKQNKQIKNETKQTNKLKTKQKTTQIGINNLLGTTITFFADPTFESIFPKAELWLILR